MFEFMQQSLDSAAQRAPAWLQDWLRDLLFADDLPDDAACEGEGCFDDAVCAACAEDGSGLHCRFCEGWPEDYRPGEDK